MSSVFFVGDTHFFHKNIYEKFGLRPQFNSIEEHNEYLVDRWNSVVTSKRDIVYHLGDVSMGKNPDILEPLSRCNGRKILVLGNHDYLPASEYLKHFEDLKGVFRYKKMWLSHMPIHPQEFYSCVANIHGHIHNVEKAIPNDPRYIPVTVEFNDLKPTSMDQIKHHIDKHKLNG